MNKYNSISELQQNVSYKIEQFKLIKTKFGERIIVLIQKKIYFLPARFARHIGEANDIEELNNVLYSLIYK